MPDVWIVIDTDIPCEAEVYSTEKAARRRIEKVVRNTTDEDVKLRLYKAQFIAQASVVIKPSVSWIEN